MTSRITIFFAAATVAAALLTGCDQPGPGLPGGKDTSAHTTRPTTTQAPDTLPQTTAEITTQEPTQPLTEETTPSPTEEPTTEPQLKTLYVDPLPLGRTEEIQKLVTPFDMPRGDEYFTGAVFLGDSVTLGLQMHMTREKKTNPGFMSDAQFICGKSYGVLNAMRPITPDSVHPLYEGEQMLPAEQLVKMNAKKVFISFGLNDVGASKKDWYVSQYSDLIDIIRAALPDIEIVILSVTPLTEPGQRTTLYNEKIMEYSNAVIQMANEKGCAFVDVAAALRDANGHLPDDLSSDNYCHLTWKAYGLYYDYLLTHPARAPGEKYNVEILPPPAE